MVVIPLFTFFSAMLYEAVAFFALRRDSRSQASRLFFVLCQLFALWALAYTFMYATADKAWAWRWYSIGAPGWCLAPAVGLHFYVSISRVGEGALWRRGVLALFYGTGLLLLSRVLVDQLVIQDLVRTNGFYWDEIIVVPDAWFWLFLVYATANTFLGAVAILIWLRRTGVRREKRQARVILWSQGSAYLILILLNVVLPSVGVRVIPSIGVAFNIFWVGLLWYSIEKYRLFALTPASMSELILQKITDGLLLLDPNLRVFQCNESFLKMLGLEEREILGREATNFFSSPLPSSLLERNRTGAATMEMEFPGSLASKTYGTLPVSTSASVIHDREGDLVGILLIVRDIRPLRLLEKEVADRKRIAGELAEAVTKARAATEAKSEFLAKISHEIRTPLNSILGTTQLLRESSLDEETKDYVKLMEHSTEALLELINDLLDISRIESGRLEIDTVPFELLEPVEEAISLIRPRATGKGVGFNVEYGNDLPPMVMGDPVRLRQILLNLLGNAVKFTEQGAVTLRIALEDGRWLVFSVQDTGIGIPGEKHGTIFEPFSQVDSGITRRYGGSGLGLAITKELVDRLNGEISLRSEPGRGSFFSVRLPFRAAGSADESGPRRAERLERMAPAASLPGFSREIHLLLAEDNPDNVAFFLAFVRGLPVKVDVAENGEEAVEAFRHGHYDLVFMDMQMPIMDGYSAVREIRRLEREGHHDHTPVVAFTAHAFEEEREKILAAGCDAHLPKPLKKQKLVECIQRYSR